MNADDLSAKENLKVKIENNFQSVLQLLIKRKRRRNGKYLFLYTYMIYKIGQNKQASRSS